MNASANRGCHRGPPAAWEGFGFLCPPIVTVNRAGRDASPRRPPGQTPFAGRAGSATLPIAGSGEGCRPAGRHAAAFTMVEIAICIAVVAFALVAIIGVLPTGLQAQKQNREETIIQQEGQFWLEAIRSGAQGLDYLTNYVDLIHTVTVTRRVGGPVDPDPLDRYVSYGGVGGFLWGRDIVGLLSLPKWHQYVDASGKPAITNTITTTNNVEAFVRALTGQAAEKTPKNDFAFAYRLTSELSPFNPFAGMNRDNTNYLAYSTNSVEWNIRSNLWARAVVLRNNAFELRLTLEWPVYQTKAGLHGLQVGNNRKVFRTLVSGSLWWTRVGHMAQRDLFFVQPSEFVFGR